MGNVLKRDVGDSIALSLTWRRHVDKSNRHLHGDSVIPLHHGDTEAEVLPGPPTTRQQRASQKLDFVSANQSNHSSRTTFGTMGKKPVEWYVDCLGRNGKKMYR